MCSGQICKDLRQVAVLRDGSIRIKVDHETS